MKYDEIKQHVVRVDNTLELIPSELLEHMEGLVRVEALWDLHFLELPLVKNVVHALMEIDSRSYYVVGTILMNDAPALYYMAGGRSGCDFYGYNILNADAYKAFAAYLHQVSLDRLELEEVDALQDDPNLTKFHGLEIRYGDHWCRDNPDETWVILHTDK